MKSDTPSPQTTAIRALITGRVQGVSFRASTAKQAKRLNIDGIARNLVDGRVEVIAVGSEQAIGELVDWLHQGPLLARVDQVRIEHLPIDNQQHDGFMTA